MDYSDDEDGLDATLGTDISDVESLSALQILGANVSTGYPVPITSATPSARLAGSGPGLGGISYVSTHGATPRIAPSFGSPQRARPLGPQAAGVSTASSSSSSHNPAMVARIASLEAQLRDKIRELNEVQSDAKNRTAHLEVQLMDLESSKRAMLQKHKQELLAQAAEFRRAQSADSAALDEAKAQLGALQSTHPDALRQAEIVKESLRDLAITEPLYLEYKSKSPAAQTIREHVCVAVYELLSASRAQYEASVRDAQSTREEVVSLRDAAGHAQRQLEQSLRSFERKEADFKAFTTDLEKQVQGLSESLARAQFDLRDREDKCRRYDMLQSRHDDLDRQLIDARTKLSEHENTMKTIADERQVVRDRMNELEQENNILKLDKVRLCVALHLLLLSYPSPSHTNDE